MNIDLNKGMLGTWVLESFTLTDGEGVEKDWGKNMAGLLIYSGTGHMSLSLNREIEINPKKSEAENILESHLFYAGTFSLKDSTVTHFIEIATNPSSIGQKSERLLELNQFSKGDDYILSVSGDAEKYGRALLKWKKVRNKK